MKKKLEADLISIAHRILKLKNKSDVNQLYIETQKLYEKLSVLRFVEEHFSDAKPTIGQAEIVEQIEDFFEKNNGDADSITENHEIVQQVVLEEIISESEIVIEEPIIEKETVADIPAFSLEIEEETAQEEIILASTSEINETQFTPAFELDNEVEVQKEKPQISFLDLLGEDYSDTLFVKVDPTNETPPAIPFDIPKKGKQKAQDLVMDVILEENELKTSINEKISQGINIGLNDRIGFVKHLFANSDEDFNRVLNQLITYYSFEEANDFIQDMVKPDYNNWEGKEDYAQRFMEIVEKKFA